MAKDPGRIPMDDPLAYFLTWTTYGSWLSGDERGWVDRPGKFREPDRDRQNTARQLMTEPALTLDWDQRQIVEATIVKHCRIRNWQLHAVNVRTQHVHVVVTAPNRNPDEVMDQFKAWCTRKLKEHAQSLQHGVAEIRQNWWTQRGSKRWLNDTEGVENAVLYVRDAQD